MMQLAAIRAPASILEKAPTSMSPEAGSDSQMAELWMLMMAECPTVDGQTGLRPTG